MASRSAETVNEPDETITRGTDNVFADLGYADAEERQTNFVWSTQSMTLLPAVG